MWNVEERFEQVTLDALPSKGFQVSSTGGVMRVEKYGCGAEFRRTPAGRYQMKVQAENPAGQEVARLAMPFERAQLPEQIQQGGGREEIGQHCGIGREHEEQE